MPCPYNAMTLFFFLILIYKLQVMSLIQSAFTLNLQLVPIWFPCGLSHASLFEVAYSKAGTIF